MFNETNVYILFFTLVVSFVWFSSSSVEILASSTYENISVLVVKITCELLYGLEIFSKLEENKSSPN